MAISSAVSASAVARVVGIKTEYKNLGVGGVTFLPQRLAIVGQGASSVAYPTTKKQVTSALEAAQNYGFGSPVHLACLQLLPVNGDGVSVPVTVYPLEDDGSGVASTGDIEPSGTQTEVAAYFVEISGIRSQSFVISPGDAIADICTAIAAAINAVLEMPVVATAGSTDVDIAAKWKGESGNDLSIKVVGSESAGTTFAVTQPTGGLVNPSVDSALAQMGEVWESMILNLLNVSDTAALDAYSDFGEGRWGALTKKPLMAFSGSTEVDRATAVTLPDSRKADRVNVQLMCPGSPDLPFVAAAGQLTRIITIANDNPPKDYGSQKAKYIEPGLDGEQWDYAAKDAAVKAGCSTVDVKDGVVSLSDTVTFYHPQGDPLPAYRYVCDIVKLQNVIFNLNLIFDNPEWDGAPLIPDDQPTINPDAKKPKTAKAAVAALVDGLGQNAIISDPDYTKERIQAAINPQNPKRLDIMVPVKLSGNANIISIDLNFGFYFDEQPLV